jgi:MFS family permease
VAAFHVGKVPPSLPSIREELGATLRQAGWLLSTVNLMTAVGGMAIALSADRFGHRRLVILGTALCMTASLFGAWSGSVEALLAWRTSSKAWDSLPSPLPARPCCCGSPHLPTRGSPWRYGPPTCRPAPAR